MDTDKGKPGFTSFRLNLQPPSSKTVELYPCKTTQWVLKVFITSLPNHLVAKPVSASSLLTMWSLKLFSLAHFHLVTETFFITSFPYHVVAKPSFFTSFPQDMVVPCWKALRSSDSPCHTFNSHSLLSAEPTPIHSSWRRRLQCLLKRWKTFNILCGLFLKAELIH
jgi:hypothetical protein